MLKKIGPFLWPLIAATLTLLSSLGPLGWPFELFTHFQVTYLWLGLIFTLALLLKRQKKAALLLLIFTFISFLQVSPYLFTKAPKATNKESTLKILSHNFLYTSTDFQSFQKMIKKEDPDVFVVHEATSLWIEELPKFENYPYQFYTAGTAMASKLPGQFERSPLYKQRAGVLTLDESQLRIVGIHTSIGIYPRLAEIQRHQIDDWISLIKKEQNPTVLIGDFNSTPWSPNFKKIQNEANLKDARLGFGLKGTWHADYPWPKIPIDHALVSSDTKVKSFKTLTCKKDNICLNSDHLPIVVEVENN